MIDESTFWNATINELKQGFIFDKVDNNYTCLICGQQYEAGVIYPVDNLLYDAHKAVQHHIRTQHSSVFNYYLGLGKIYTGLSASQTELAKLFYKGYSDKEIVEMTESNSTSTIRNQRFSIREKYKQAKILTALVEMLEEQMAQAKHGRQMASDDKDLVDFHRTATNVDERYAITQAEKDAVLGRYFGPNNEVLIHDFPAKEKKKIIIMQHIIKEFESNNNYTEKQINEVLKKYYDDYVTIRRYLIQYGFLDRSKDGEHYWIKL